MSSVTFADQSDHQYDELHAHDRRKRPQAAPCNSGDRNGPARKKANEDANESADSCEGPRQDASSKVFRILAVVGFFFALAVLIAVMFLAVGVLSPPDCHECTNDLAPSSGRASGLRQELLVDLVVIKELSSNISELYAMVKSKTKPSRNYRRETSSSQARSQNWSEKRAIGWSWLTGNTNANLSCFTGQQGPQGYAGAAGLRGEDGLDGKSGKRVPGNMTSLHEQRWCPIYFGPFWHRAQSKRDRHGLQTFTKRN